MSAENCIGFDTNSGDLNGSVRDAVILVVVLFSALIFLVICLMCHNRVAEQEEYGRPDTIKPAYDAQQKLTNKGLQTYVEVHDYFKIETREQEERNEYIMQNSCPCCCSPCQAFCSRTSQLFTQNGFQHTQLRTFSSILSIYGTVILALLVELSAITVFAKFYAIAYYPEDDQNCAGLHPRYIFWLSIGCLFAYRSFSALWVGWYTQNWFRGGCQFVFEQELWWYSMKTNAFLRSTYPCYAQTILFLFHSIFLTIPLNIICMTFLMRTQVHSGVLEIYVLLAFYASAVFVNKLDNEHFKEDTQNFCNNACWWLIRFLFRYFDVLATVFVRSLIWATFSFHVLFVVILFDAFVTLIILIVHRAVSDNRFKICRWDLCLCLCGTLISRVYTKKSVLYNDDINEEFVSENDTHDVEQHDPYSIEKFNSKPCFAFLDFIIVLYHFIENLYLIIIVFIWTDHFNDDVYDCWDCIDEDHHNYLINRRNVEAVYVIAIIAMVCVILFYAFFRCIHVCPFQQMCCYYNMNIVADYYYYYHSQKFLDFDPCNEAYNLEMDVYKNISREDQFELFVVGSNRFDSDPYGDCIGDQPGKFFWTVLKLIYTQARGETLQISDNFKIPLGLRLLKTLFYKFHSSNHDSYDGSSYYRKENYECQTVNFFKMQQSCGSCLRVNRNGHPVRPMTMMQILCQYQYTNGIFDEFLHFIKCNLAKNSLHYFQQTDACYNNLLHAAIRNGNYMQSQFLALFFERLFHILAKTENTPYLNEFRCPPQSNDKLASEKEKIAVNVDSQNDEKIKKLELNENAIVFVGLLNQLNGCPVVPHNINPCIAEAVKKSMIVEKRSYTHRINSITGMHENIGDKEARFTPAMVGVVKAMKWSRTTNCHGIFSNAAMLNFIVNVIYYHGTMFEQLANKGKDTSKAVGFNWKNSTEQDLLRRTLIQDLLHKEDRIKTAYFIRNMACPEDNQIACEVEKSCGN